MIGGISKYRWYTYKNTPYDKNDVIVIDREYKTAVVRVRMAMDLIEEYDRYSFGTITPMKYINNQKG